MNFRCFPYAVVVFLVLVFGLMALGQTAPLAPGTVSGVALLNMHNGQPLGTCPTDFYSPTGNSPVCYSATMSCVNPASTPDLAFEYSYLMPPAPVLGTVVLFTGDGGVLGTVQQADLYAKDYYNLHYEVVEVAWQTDWEQTAPNGVNPAPGILTAACRPAGFLDYVLNTPLLNARSINSTNGLCAQGASAGSGALGYALAWYADRNGAFLNTDLDDVELVSGPVFGNIEMGCHVGGYVPVVPICYPGQQVGCSNGTTGWSANPQYVDHYLTQVQAWTGSLTPACGGSQNTSSNDPKWQAMSIVTGTGGSFSYPTLGMGGWLCASSRSGTCTAPACPNNSAAEGEQFYNQILSGSQPVNYKLTGIVDCNGAEIVSSGYDPDNGCTIDVNCLSGSAAIEAHLQAQCKHPSPH